MSKLRDKVKALQDIKKEQVTVDEWEGMVLEARTMRAVDRAKLLRDCVDKEGTVVVEKFQTGLIIASYYDPETGEKVFADEDYDVLLNKSAGVIERLANVAMNLSGLSKDTIATAEKNS